jgi:predicted type IV restriction endonuclease
MTIEALSEVLERIRSDRRILDYDEITTKQKIILQILAFLEWNIFSDEVVPEYSVEGKRVDYSLRLTNRNLVFIEIKKPKEELQQHERQLLDYAFRLGVEIAILTNGITWWFYLPTKPGDWNSRKFYTIDLSEQEIKSCAERLIEFLSKEKVRTGEAVKAAEKVHKSRVRKNTIDQTLPESWNKLISEPDSLLIDLLVESTEKLCGYRPEAIDVQTFLKDKQEQLILDTIEDVIAHERISGRKAPIEGTSLVEIPTVSSLSANGSGRKSGLIKVLFNGQVFETWSISQLYSLVLTKAVDSGDISKLSVPWGLGSKRYFLFKGQKPKHANGRDFFTPVSYKGYHLEANVNRSSGIKYIKEFCQEIGYKLEILES